MVENAQSMTLLFLVVVSLCIASPVSAIVQEITYRGSVTAMDPLTLTLTIRAESQYGCNYTGGQPSCGFMPIAPVQVVGAVPDEGLFNTFHNGDLVTATILGGTGGQWAGIALVVLPPGSSTYVATDIYGDPKTIPVALGGDYKVDYTTLPDCSSCSGSVCKALSAHVVVRSGETIVQEQSLNNGQSTRYSGRNDGSSISVLYLSGEAPGDSCPGATPVTGMQPISNFVIHVTPPVGGFSGPRETVQQGPVGEGAEKPNGTAVPEKTQAGWFFLSPAAAVGVLAMLRWACGKNR